MADHPASRDQLLRTNSPAPRVVVPACDRPDVSFVIVGYGTGPVLIDTIHSIVTTVSATSYEVIVVDNPHPVAVDRTYAELLLSTSGVRVVRPDRNLGFGGGNNLGVELARGEYVVMLNPDVTLQDGWLTPLLTVLEDESVAIVAPALLNPDGTVQECGQRLIGDGISQPIQQRPADSEPFDVDYSSAACWVMRRTVFTQLGGFDLRYHPAYFEDADLAMTARAGGLRCVVNPAVSAVHHRGTGTPDTAPLAEHQRQVFRDKWGQ